MTDGFEQSVAHAARDRTQIAIRRVMNAVYGKGRSLLRKRGKRSAEKAVCVPAVTDLTRAADLFNRMNWYLGGLDRTGVLPTPHTRASLRKRVQSLEHQRTYDDAGQVDLVPTEQTTSAIERTDQLLVWDWRALFYPSVLRRLHKTILVDPYAYSTREVMEWYQEFCGTVQRSTSRQKNRDRFHHLQEQFADHEEAYVFATGPSLDTVFDHSISEGALRVICNSIVRNDKLLEYLDPDILTFADPVFHFGPSEYAAQFRDDAVETIREYDCWCVVNTPGDELLRAQFPDIADRVIGIPDHSDLDRFHIPSASELFVRSTGNIMTLLMLPVAAAFADQISILGADGREENESYFWEHSSAAQYEGLMNSAVETHPSFFRDRLYEDYYDQHIERLRELIETQEAEGKSYYSVTPSYIPVLSERKMGETPG